MARRMERVNDLLRDELSNLIQHQLKDPRLPLLVSVRGVVASTDLQHARVYISVMGSKEEQQGALDALHSAAGFLHRELRPRLKWRHIPTLQFVLDTSLEQGAHVLELMKQVAADRESPAP